MTAQTALVLAGACFEVVGIALVGAADLFPPTRAWLQVLAAALKRAHSWVERVILHRRRAVTEKVDMGGAIAVGGRVSAIVSTDPSGTVDAKVDFLVREAQRSQERVNALEDAVEDLHAEIRRREAAAREQLRVSAAAAIRGALEAYARERRTGVLCLGVALLLWTLSAFVS